MFTVGVLYLSFVTLLENLNTTLSDINKYNLTIFLHMNGFVSPSVQ